VRVAVVLLAAVAAVWSSLLPASASPLPNQKFILVVIDRVLWPDYAEAPAPALRELCRTGALGLMNVRTVLPIAPEATYLSIGASSRAAAPLQPLALQVGEQFQDIDAGAAFQGRTGLAPPPGGAVYLSIGAAIRDNQPEQRHYICQPGLLGAALAQARITVAAIGNADLPLRPRREIVALAMDERGVVPVAAVDSRVDRAAAGSATGLQTNSDALLKAFDRVAAKAQFVAVETGDTSRLAEVESEMMPDLVVRERRKAILRVDGFLRGLLRRATGKPWQIIIVSPTPRLDPARTPDAMTPMILAGWQVKPGLLSSPSTRTPGEVTNTDLAPTILRFFGAQPPAEVFGRPITILPREPGEALPALLRLDAQISAADRSRPIILDTLAALMSAVLFMATFGLLLDDRAPRALATALRGLSLAMMASLLALLLAGAHVAASTALAAIGVLALTIAIGAIVSLRGRGWLWLAGITSALVVLDSVSGQHLLRGSLMGYSPAVGSRYYGMGNEYGGVMMAAVPLALLGWFAAGATPRRWQRLAITAAFLVAAVMVGHPAAGANLGIALSCAIGYGAALALLAPGGVSWRRVLGILGAAVAVVALIVAADLLRGGAESHIGRSATQIETGGWSAFIDIVGRRALRNWMLTQHSAWGAPAILGFAVLAVAVIAAPRRVKAVCAGRRALIAAFGGIAIGAAAAYVLEDSGIVVAALALCYAAAALTYLSFRESTGPNEIGPLHPARDGEAVGADS
jgi:hypothetical protein